MEEEGPSRCGREQRTATTAPARASPKPRAADTRFDRLIARTQDACATRHSPTAYDTRVAARCEAEAAQNIPDLLLVRTIAEEHAARGARPVSLRPLVTYRTLGRKAKKQRSFHFR